MLAGSCHPLTGGPGALQAAGPREHQDDKCLSWWTLVGRSWRDRCGWAGEAGGSQVEGQGLGKAFPGSRGSHTAATEGGFLGEGEDPVGSDSQLNRDHRNPLLCVYFLSWTIPSSAQGFLLALTSEITGGGRSRDPMGHWG